MLNVENPLLCLGKENLFYFDKNFKFHEGANNFVLMYNSDVSKHPSTTETSLHIKSRTKTLLVLLSGPDRLFHNQGHSHGTYEAPSHSELSMIDEGSNRWAKLALTPSAATSKNLSHTYTMMLSQHCTGTHSHKVPRASIQLCFINMYWKLFPTLRQVLFPWRLGPPGVCACTCV